ncbi:CDP-alcohol phosphatidyltransferase [Coraliomargarita sinensis]|uniref:CDP-alcohol phosphatidyltransferase n=1 Tax=Coraliomargarita sinensis TaxID=2174842 RepID=A0A317ZH86_9BACT|nr:CDP-alcohol phosphatidyltransferase family protein [Coraliomargarita sinensis]PXA04975.1 CDP-alcohol phosphatidyltransferase [Coraliomargarita sinensis]
MVSVYQLKTGFQNLLRPLVRQLAGAGITANAVTLFAFFLSLLVGLWLAFVPASRLAYLAYPLLLFIRMALNAMDGMLARECGQKSHLGAFLNELCDVLSDAALYLALGMLATASMGLAAIFTTLAVTTEVTGLTAAGIGASRRYDGPMGKSDRAFVIGAYMLIAAFVPNTIEWMNPLLIVLSMLCILTIFNRIHKGLQELKKVKI